MLLLYEALFFKKSALKSYLDLYHTKVYEGELYYNDFFQTGKLKASLKSTR